jgi:hypothetical protein
MFFFYVLKQSNRKTHELSWRLRRSVPPAGGAKRANTPKWGPWTDERGARERNRDGGLELPGFRKQRKVRLHALS